MATNSYEGWSLVRQGVARHDTTGMQIELVTPRNEFHIWHDEHDPVGFDVPTSAGFGAVAATATMWHAERVFLGLIAPASPTPDMDPDILRRARTESRRDDGMSPTTVGAGVTTPRRQDGARDERKIE